MSRSKVRLNRTARPIRPVLLGHLSGEPIFQARGGSGEDDDQQGGQSGENAPSNGGAGDGDDWSESSSDSKDQGDPQKKIVALEEEKNRHHTARQKAETDLAEAQRKIAEFEAKERTAEEQVAHERDELAAQVQTVAQQNRDLSLENAFLKDNTYAWHNPARALSLVDLSDVKIGEDGKVEGLADALKALAESDPYLIKQASDTDNDSKGNKDSKPPKSGDPTPKRRPGELSRAELEAKFPALRRS